MSKKTSRGALNSILVRCSRLRTYAELRAYMSGDQLADMFGALGQKERPVAIATIAEAYRRCADGAPIPRAGTVRVKAWDAARIAKLREAEKRFGNDDEIARHLGLPIKSVRTARWKYCGPRRSRTGPQTPTGSDAR